MTGRIFSPGKLLLTSEYFVLDGALALAVPTTPGQEFFFEEKDDAQSTVFWEALHQGEPWLSVRLNYKTWTILDTNLPQSAEFVLRLLKTVQQHSGTRFQGSVSYHLKTNLQFPADFGLGSSSTLINNIAQWSDSDPYLLNTVLLHGSGYDIAVAREKRAILFQNAPELNVKPVHYSPMFKDDLLFVHINRKQDSRAGIQLYRSKEKSADLINRFSELTAEVYNSTNLPGFLHLMEEHENLVSEFIGLPKIKDRFFADYGGTVKSLGAWGGDFVLASSHGDFKSYFAQRGYQHVFTWDQLILSP